MALSDLLQQACFQVQTIKNDHIAPADYLGWVIFLASVTVSSVRMSMFRQQPALIKQLAGDPEALQEWRKSRCEQWLQIVYCR